MQLVRFPEAPAFESLLDGSQSVDLLAVFAEVGSCRHDAVNDWIDAQSDTFFQLGTMLDQRLAADELLDRLPISVVDSTDDGRVGAMTISGTAWDVTVAVATCRLLQSAGFSTSVVTVLGQLFVQLDLSEGLLLYAPGIASGWVPRRLALEAVAESVGLVPEALQDAVAAARPRFLVEQYLRCICEADVLKAAATPAARQMLAALDPSDPSRWIAVAEAALQAGRASEAFELAARLERSGVSESAGVRRRAELALAGLN